MAQRCKDIPAGKHAISSKKIKETNSKICTRASNMKSIQATYFVTVLKYLLKVGSKICSHRSY